MQIPLDMISIYNKIKDDNIEIRHSTSGMDMYTNTSY